LKKGVIPGLIESEWGVRISERGKKRVCAKSGKKVQNLEKKAKNFPEKRAEFGGCCSRISNAVGKCSSVLKKGDRHLAIRCFFEDSVVSSEPVPVFQQPVSIAPGSDGSCNSDLSVVVEMTKRDPTAIRGRAWERNRNGRQKLKMDATYGQFVPPMKKGPEK
jgi:hypothetical protein